MAHVYQWKAVSSQGFDVLIPNALGFAATATAKVNPWQRLPTEGSGAGYVQIVRAMLVATMYVVDRLSTKAPTTPSTVIEGTEVKGPMQLGERTSGDYSSPERAGYAADLLRTLYVLRVDVARSNGTPSGVPLERTTLDGNPPLPGIVATDAGGWPLAAVGIVGITAAALTICYLADKSDQLAANQLANQTQTAQMMATHARVLQVHAMHLDREQAAGKELPFSDEEKAILGMLGESQKTAAKAIKSEMPSLFPNMKDMGGGIVAAATATSWAVIAAVALGFYLLTKGRS